MCADDEAGAAYIRRHRYFSSPKEERTMTRRLHALLNGSDDPAHPLIDPAGPFDAWIGDLDLESPPVLVNYDQFFIKQ